MDSGSPSSVALLARAGGSPENEDPAVKALKDAADGENQALWTYLFYVCGAVSVAVIAWKIVDITTKHVRHIVCLNNDRQRYFAVPSPSFARLKQHVLYAPIFRKRHNREIQLSSAVNIGTLPTRFQLFFLVAYFATNVAFCVIEIPFAADYEVAAGILRNRAGVLSTINMVPLFLLAGRNNPLIPLLGISFDTYNLLHRWFGRIVILEAILHTLAHLAKGGWNEALPGIFKAPFLYCGFIATIAFVVIGIQASSPLRHAFYEIFKLLHIALAIAAVIGLWYHLQLKELWIWLPFLYAVVALWGFDRLTRVLRLLYHNIGGSGSRTIVQALPGNAVRVTMVLARPWNFRPGQHAYLYMPRLSFWQSHPFSVSWADGVDDVMADKLASTNQERKALQKSEIAFIIRGRTGFTDTLYQQAAASPGGKMDVACYVEGPYGAKHPLDSYGTTILFAGGVGVTHQVPYVKDLVAGFSEGTVATRRVLLVWTIQCPEHLEWIRPWMTEILGMDRRRDILRIMIFVSQPRSSKEIHSPSSTVQMFPGRPNIETILSMEQEQQVGAMAVSVCGPGTLSDEVRRAVRSRQSRSSIDFIEEAFSW